MARIKGLILAGGQARRFGGGDKGLALFAGRPLISFAADALAGLEFAISANGDPERFAAFGCPVLADAGGPGLGPLNGLAAGLAWASDAEVLVTIPCDTVFLPEGLTAALLPAPAFARADGRDHFLVASWPVAAAPRLASALDGGMRRVGDFSALIGARAATFESGGTLFRNINRREDLMANAPPDGFQEPV